MFVGGLLVYVEEEVEVCGDVGVGVWCGVEADFGLC